MKTARFQDPNQIRMQQENKLVNKHFSKGNPKQIFTNESQKAPKGTLSLDRVRFTPQR